MVRRLTDLIQKDKDKNKLWIASFLGIGRLFKQDIKSAHLKRKNSKLICIKNDCCYSKKAIRRVKKSRHGLGKDTT